MMYRLATACWLLQWALVLGYGEEKKAPQFTWTGRWEKTDPPIGAKFIHLYYSPDGLKWRYLRADLSCNDFPGTDGKPLGLKNMTIYCDAEKKQIHGMLSVWDEKTQDWCKYHNIAKVTWR